MLTYTKVYKLNFYYAKMCFFNLKGDDKMKQDDKSLIIDLDGTLTIDDDLPYIDKRPNLPLIAQLREYKAQGFSIVIFTSRAMRSYEGDLEQIRANALPTILAWLEKHKVPFDNVVIGKIWCGFSGFYVDDRAIRPSEFVNLSLNQISELLEKEKQINAQSALDSASNQKATQ